MATEAEMAQGLPRNGAADAAAPAAPAAAAPDPAANSISVTAGLLGLSADDPELDDLKETGKIMVSGGAQKRPKLTHSLFFEDERGFKKMQKTFPKIPFQGKGYEFRDLKLLMAHYDHWVKELYPSSDNTEETVKRSRVLLSENMKGDDGHVSNPRERLHLLRYEYKAAQAAAAAPKAVESVPEDVKQRIEANRLRALELKKRREQQSAGAGASSDMDADARRRTEENKARAMEMKKLREMEELVAEMEGVSANPIPAGLGANAPRVQADTLFDEEDDPFGFGGGFDAGGFGGGFAPSQAPNKAVAAAAPRSQAPAGTMFDEEEDPFGHAHGGFDDEMPSSMGALPQSSAPAAPPAATMPAPPATVATPVAATGKASSMDDDAKRRIEENKARALRLKRQREEAAAAAVATTAPPARDQEVAPPPGVHQQADTSSAPPQQQQQQRHFFDEEDDVFQYGDDLDDEF